MVPKDVKATWKSCQSHSAKSMDIIEEYNTIGLFFKYIYKFSAWYIY